MGEREFEAVVETALAGEDRFRRDEIAAQAGYSVAQTTRRMRRLGETPTALVRRVRLERAAFRLRGSSFGVAQIAQEAGFGGTTTFARAFRRAYGASPTEFRRTGGHVPLLPSVSGVHWHPRLSPSGWGRRLRPRETTMIEPKLIPFGAKRIAFRRHLGTNPGIDSTWAEVNRETAVLALRRPETRYFTRFHDGPEAAPESCRSDAMLTLAPGVEMPEGYEEGELPAGEYAVFVHTGPDDGIVDTWARAFEEWLPASGRAFDGVTFEEYVNGFYERPERPDERLIVTAVYLKLAPR